jgi:hypothetical protein
VGSVADNDGHIFQLGSVADNDGHIFQLDADHAVISGKHQRMHLLRQSRLGPFMHPTADRAVRTAGGGDALVPRSMHQRGHDMLERHPVRDAPSVTAERMHGIHRRVIRQHGDDLCPDGLHQ